MRQNGASRISGGFFGRPEAIYTNDDDVTYELDHLATYTVAPHRGLGTIEDALARLRRMVQSSGVWTKRLKLRIGARDLVVVEGIEPIERFPLRLVGQCVAAAPCEGYENVVAISVANDDLLRRPPEIHLFQCVGKQVGCTGRQVDIANAIHAFDAKARCRKICLKRLKVDVIITRLQRALRWRATKEWAAFNITVID
jgi:hypothetical protein